MKNLIEFNRIQLHDMTYGDDLENPIFNKITVDMPMNRVVRVAGVSGSGKSTLMQILAGLVLPREGFLLVNGIAVSELSFEEFTPYRLNVGYTFEYGGLIHNKTLKENILLPIQYHPQVSKRRNQEDVIKMIKDFGMEHTMNKRPSDVPGSHRKITVLLRAFVMHPEVLILDNPTMGLNESSRECFFDLIKTERKNGNCRHIFVATDDNHFLNNFETETCLVENGKLNFLAGKEGRKVG